MSESLRTQSISIGRKISFPCFQSLHYRCRGNRTSKEEHKRTSCECLCHKDQIQIIHKQTLKTRTNLNMLKVTQYGENDWDVKNLKNQHNHIVRWNDDLKTLCCTCMFGSQEISSGKIAEDKRCIHIRAVRRFLKK